MADYSLRSDFVKQLDGDILKFVHKGFENRDEEKFNQLALREFELQYHTIRTYKDYCRKKNLSPATITQWHEVPPVTSFPLMKHLYVSDEGSLGVVEINKKRSPIFPDNSAAEIINTTNSITAKRFLFPDLEKIRMLILAPPPEMALGMVMASGLRDLKNKFGTADSEFIISFRGLKLKSLLNALEEAEQSEQPIALMGAAMVIDYFLDACKKEGIRFHLPKGSRLCESGGYMGRYTKCPKDEFINKGNEILRIEEGYCINAFWVCESSTVYFDNTLKDIFSGFKKVRYKEIPPWSRVIVVDPHNFQRLPKGEIGLIRHYDITNRAFAFSVQTDKMGYETDNGFDVVGKLAEGALSHPGGRLVTKIIDYYMKRKFSKLTSKTLA